MEHNFEQRSSQSLIRILSYFRPMLADMVGTFIGFRPESRR
jgi:hypothetical protein